jgi:transposase-like protein
MSIADDPIYQNADKAREWLEAVLWAGEPICPHCGLVGVAKALQGKAHRAGVYKCKGCEQQFTVTVGTVFERSHIPLNKWLLAIHLMTASKKGISSLQLSRMLGLTYKSAWFMSHRVREAMRDGTLPEKLGGEGKVAEADETYIGGKETNKHKSKRTAGMQGGKGKEAVFSLVERGGKVRSLHLPSVTAKNVGAALHAQLNFKSYLMTDEAPVYVKIADVFSGHATVNHSAEEYVRLGGFVHTNTVEGFFSLVKRSIYGTHHHISQQHLGRYLAERDFLYNNRIALGVDDGARMVKAAQGIVGKRLTYRRTGGAKEAAQGASA